MKRAEVTAYLDKLLMPPGAVDDASNNGLQVEGRDMVNRVVFGVDASLALFEAAAAAAADLVVVHHGISWGGGLKRLTGIEAGRLRVLFAAELSLYACHLPLDGHPEVGNNAVIARLLGLPDAVPFAAYGGLEIGRSGRLPEPLFLSVFASRVEEALKAEAVQVLPFGPRTVSRVGIVSGGGADALGDCAALGLDCLLTGEVLHQHVHPAREMGISVIAAGHYRTETTGIRAVMERVEQDLGLECRFVDLPTGL